MDSLDSTISRLAELESRVATLEEREKLLAVKVAEHEAALKDVLPDVARQDDVLEDHERQLLKLNTLIDSVHSDLEYVRRELKSLALFRERMEESVKELLKHSLDTSIQMQTMDATIAQVAKDTFDGFQAQKVSAGELKDILLKVLVK